MLSVVVPFSPGERNGEIDSPLPGGWNSECVHPGEGMLTVRPQPRRGGIRTGIAPLRMEWLKAVEDLEDSRGSVLPHVHVAQNMEW